MSWIETYRTRITYPRCTLYGTRPPLPAGPPLAA